MSSRNRVYPFQIRPKSGLGGRWPIRWRPGTSVERGTRFWPSGFRVYPILAIALNISHTWDTRYFFFVFYVLESHYSEFLSASFLFFFGLMPVSSSSSSCCFACAAAVCSLSARIYVVLVAFLILHHVLQNSCRLFCLLYLPFFFSFFWSGLFCCVLVPGTLAFHVPHLD